MINYKKERIVIIGLGITGFSCVEFFLERGVIPIVMDMQVFPRYLKKLPYYVKCYTGGLNEKLLLTSTLIVVSPGISLFHPILVEAARLGIEIIGDIELFVREVHGQIIAITGSSGKSTVTALLTCIAARSGLIVGVGGNIGFPVLKLLKHAYQLYILELSSFQLETTYSLYATVSTVLNVSYDHMNRYSCGLSEYCSVKLKIYKNARFCLVNASDFLTYPISKDCVGHCISFGNEVGDYHLGWKHDRRYLMIDKIPVLDCSEIKILGFHNHMNALAALALADILMIPRKYSLLVLRRFSGLSHCLQLVHKRNGTCWINDSKATNIGSAIAGINTCLNLTNGILHLLLGGDGKCVDFLHLAYLVQKEKIKVYCFGKDKKNLANLRFYDSVVTDNLEKAMRIISNSVKKNDIVLLSPACSSLDQFNNFRVRGNVFSQLARKIG